MEKCEKMIIAELRNSLEATLIHAYKYVGIQNSIIFVISLKWYYTIVV